MKDYGLNFISNRDLYNHVKETVEEYTFNLDLAKFTENIIDPIKLTFDSKIYNKTIEEVIESEVIRQIDKANNNHIGYFHQKIFKYFGNGWEVPERGFDIINNNLHIYAEMKNKHNTMNSDSSQKVFIKLQNKVLNDSQATCYLVEVIAKHSQNIVWECRVDGEIMSHPNIKRISVDKFYELATGESDSFSKLCEVLPIVLNEVIDDLGEREMNNTVFDELNSISPDLLKNFYLISFREYAGFSNFSFKEADDLPEDTSGEN